MGLKRTISILGVFGLLVSSFAATSAFGSPAYEPPRVELRGVNVISGDGIAGMEVRIPRPTTIEANPFDNANVSYEGRGRIVGFALVEEGETLRKAFQLVAVRWDFCGRPGCTSGDRDELVSTTSWGGKRYRIPAGDYRLYVIADGAPARVELRLDGLHGRTSLRPTGDVAGRISVPSGTVHPSNHLFLGAARPMVMPTPGLMIDGDEAAFRNGPHFGARGSCFWRVRFEEEPPERALPGPHCYKFSERTSLGAGGGVLGGGSAGWGIGNVPAGKWRSSYWSADVGVNPKTRFLTLWLAYEDPT